MSAQSLLMFQTAKDPAYSTFVFLHAGITSSLQSRHQNNKFQIQLMHTCPPQDIGMYADVWDNRLRKHNQGH